MTVSEGFSGIFMCFGAHADVKIKPHKLFDIDIFGELTAAPKILTVNTGETESFNFGKRSLGVLANFNHHFASGRHYLFLGAGPAYHSMKFKNYSASTLGARADLGINLNFNKIELRPVFFFDIANADDSGFSMNYTSGNIGISILF
jgi:hypothetical protein